MPNGVLKFMTRMWKTFFPHKGKITLLNFVGLPNIFLMLFKYSLTQNEILEPRDLKWKLNQYVSRVDLNISYCLHVEIIDRKDVERHKSSGWCALNCYFPFITNCGDVQRNGLGRSLINKLFCKVAMMTAIAVVDDQQSCTWIHLKALVLIMAE